MHIRKRTLQKSVSILSEWKVNQNKNKIVGLVFCELILRKLWYRLVACYLQVYILSQDYYIAIVNQIII